MCLFLSGCYWFLCTIKDCKESFSHIPCTNCDLKPAGSHTYPMQSSMSVSSSDSLPQVALHFVPVYLFSRYQGTPCSHSAHFADHVPTEHSNQR